MQFNLPDVTRHWIALHEAMGIGAAISDEAEYEQALPVVEQLFEGVVSEPSHPLGGLVELLADRIRAYEARVHPSPDKGKPAADIR